MEIKWRRGFRAIDKVTVEVEEALMTHEELDKYVCEEYERRRGEANKDRDHLRAQLQTLREALETKNQKIVGLSTRLLELDTALQARESQLQTLRGEVIEARREYEGSMAEEIVRLREVLNACRPYVAGSSTVLNLLDAAPAPRPRHE